MNTKHVIVEDYNPEWKNEFERISNELQAVLTGKIISIEHVGSMSVQGLAAKPKSNRHERTNGDYPYIPPVEIE